MQSVSPPAPSFELVFAPTTGSLRSLLMDQQLQEQQRRRSVLGGGKVPDTSISFSNTKPTIQGGPLTPMVLYYPSKASSFSSSFSSSSSLSSMPSTASTSSSSSLDSWQRWSIDSIIVETDDDSDQEE